MNPTVEKELREQLDHLLPEQQRQVVDFARALAAARQSTASGSSLSRFVGTIPKEDLAVITQTVEEGCERVNPDEW